MKITKLGHCCLLIEQKGARLLTDPGTFSTGQDELQDIDAVLITHEHADHLHVDSLKRVLANNPEAAVICNAAVAKLLDEAGISYLLMADGERRDVEGLDVEAYEVEHAEIFRTLPRVRNTGFFIAGTLFYPGDAYIQPGKPVDVLALPVAGPWLKLSEALDYALAVKPRVAFPVHDGILKVPGMMNRAYSSVLGENGIAFEPLGEGEAKEF